MGAPCPSICSPWADIADICNPPDVTDETLEQQLLNASNILFHFTGRQWPGSCAETVRPCGGGSEGWCGCSGGRTCGCRRPSEIRLGGSPITSVTEVKIDGAVLDPSLYRVDDWTHLVYLPADDDERQGWPCCQDVRLPDSEENTWSVAYTYGTGPDVGGSIYAAELAGELARACAGDTECRLPKRVQTIVRQGVTLAVVDPLNLFEDGRTGLPDVDLWLGSLRYGRRKRRATVMIPGQGRRVRRVGT
jgi:hypothetical protein